MKIKIALVISIAINIFFTSFFGIRKYISYQKTKEYNEGQAYKIRRLNFLNKTVVPPRSFILAGNSIVENLNEKRLGENVYNFGISGNTTIDLYNRLPQIIIHRPSKILIKIGINDLKNGLPVDYALYNYSRILTKLKEELPACIIYIHSVFPVSKDRGDLIVKVRDFNQSLKYLALKNNLRFIEAYSDFIDSSGYLREGYTTDGLHLNSNGYNAWVLILKNEIFQ